VNSYGIWNLRDGCMYVILFVHIFVKMWTISCINFSLY